MFFRNLCSVQLIKVPKHGSGTLNMARKMSSADPAAAATTTTDKQQSAVLPYSSVPGPSKFEVVREALPGGATYGKSTIEIMQHYHDKYGTVFQLPALFGKPKFLMTFNPEDFAIVFRNEGKYPNRLTIESSAYHRQVYRREFFDGVEGLVSSQGEKWAEIRTVANPVLMDPKNIQLYLGTLHEVSDDFITKMRFIRDPTTLEMPANFYDEIHHLTLESVASVALNKRLGLLSLKPENAHAQLLLEKLHRVFDLIFYLDVQPSVWKIVKTPKFYEMMKCLDFLTDSCVMYINEAMEAIEKKSQEETSTSGNENEKSILEKLCQKNRKIGVVMALDMILAGVDTTSATLSAIFLCLANNPDVQEKLFEEIKQVLPNKDSRLTTASMKNMPYLRACIKEGMRLYPVLPGTLRCVANDVVLSGYQVPKGVHVGLQNSLTMLQDKFVPRSKEYLPERWLRNNTESDLLRTQMNPFSLIPFGFGPRSCIGRRFVQLEMEINIARLIRNFQLSFNYSMKNAFKSKFLTEPAIPLKFKCVDRKE